MWIRNSIMSPMYFLGMTGVLLRPVFSKSFWGYIVFFSFFLGLTGVLLRPGFSKVFMGLYCTFQGKLELSEFTQTDQDSKFNTEFSAQKLLFLRLGYLDKSRWLWCFS